MSEKIAALIESIKGLTVLELSELVHALEDTFGVSAAAVAAGPASSSMLWKTPSAFPPLPSLLAPPPALLPLPSKSRPSLTLS